VIGIHEDNTEYSTGTRRSRTRKNAEESSLAFVYEVEFYFAERYNGFNIDR
jgi:hypothetical protein